MRALNGRTAIGLIAAFCTFGSAVTASAQEVNVYSYRQAYLIQPLLDAFTKKTGVKTNVIYASKGLIERMAAEGQNSPADVLLTADIGLVTSAVSDGVTQPVESATLEKNIPARYRDPENQWFGLTTRARVVYASKDRVKQDTITYEELADPKWKGRICVRSGQHPYNVALTAALISHEGEEAAKKWLQGVRDNLAKKPAGGDRDQAKAIFAGECDIALGNTYYMGAMSQNEKEPEQKEWAASIKVLFPNAQERGTHMNISGMSMAKNAPNRENALKLMEYLTSDEAQKIYAELNNEYPVKPGVERSGVVKSWGDFKEDTLALSDIAKARKRASELVDEVRFDEGPGAS